MDKVRKEKIKKRIIYLVIFIILISTIFFLVKKFDKNKESSESSAKPVKTRTFTLQEKITDEELEFFGTLEANKEANLSSKISGRIDSFKVKEGDSVRKGQLLVTIFPDQNAIDFWNKNREYNNFQNYRSEQENYFDKKVKTASEEVEIQKEERDYIKIHDPARLEIAEDEVDKAEAALKTAKRERDAQKESLKQQSDNFSGSRNLAAQNVIDTKIRAPFDGVVTRKFAEEGEVVNFSIGGTLLSVAEVSSYKVVVEIPDYLIEKLSTGLKARVILDGISEAQVATVTLINPKVDAVSKKIEVEVTLDCIPHNVKVDMFARVFIKFPPRIVYLVPNNFIFSGFEGPFVILENGTYAHIQRGREYGDMTEITFAGITSGINLKR